MPKVCPGFAQGFAQGFARDLELNFRCSFVRKQRTPIVIPGGIASPSPSRRWGGGRGRGREGLCDTWLAVEIAEKSIAANVTGKRRGEKYRERENIRKRLFASARRTWPATAAEVVKRLVLTTSANSLGPLTRRRRELKGCAGGWEWGCGVGW